MENETLAGLHKVAQHFNLPAGWIKKEAISGRLPALRVGRRMLFNLAAVESALAARAAMRSTHDLMEVTHA